MSRCFPFPPPGYVKKARGDDVDLLNKEKQKEKTHKKEKKDNEKDKDKDKEKREKKDRSDGKHKDKKEKKEKHKDKDKDKKKEKSRDKEKKFPDHPAGQNGEKTSDEKKFAGKSEGHSGEKFIPKDKGRDKDRSSFSGEEKLAGHISSYNGEKISQNSHLAEDIRDSKIVQELARRVRDEGAEARSQLADKFMGSERKREERMVSFVAKTANKLAEEKEKTKRSDDRKFDVQGTKEETRAGGNAMVPNLSGAVKARVEGIPKQVENHAERQWQGREKVKEKEGNDKIRDKRKDKDREKKSHGKDKDRDKRKEKNDKVKSEHRNLELNNLKGSNKDEPPDTLNIKTSNLDLDNNGFLHVNDIKLAETSSAQPLVGSERTSESSAQPLAGSQRTSESSAQPLAGSQRTSESSAQPLAGSQRKSESCEAVIPLTLDSKGVDNKKRKVNGTIEAQVLSVSPTKHLSPGAHASKKSPHPDVKYLSQVLSVPKMEEWADFDDESWLSIESQSKKPKVGFSVIDEPPQVWAEPLQIESADVWALPYVIPY